jgi:hypothetical protein
VVVEKSQSKVSQGKSVRPYLKKKKTETKGLGTWLKWLSTYLVSMKPEFKPSITKKKY